MVGVIRAAANLVPMATGGLVLADYSGACLSSVVPALVGRRQGAPHWLPEPAVAADQVVLLLIDGLGWIQLQDRLHLATTLGAMVGGPITTVAPSTTATALTSLTTGMTPAEHGVVGYRLRLGSAQVLNVLRWSTPSGDARRFAPPSSLQRQAPFCGLSPPVVTRADFERSGFSAAHLAGSEFVGWQTPSGIPVQVRRLLGEGERLVYAYYPGLDTVAHAHGFGDLYDAELVAVDRLVAELIDALPPGACLVAVSDHGQVEVGERLMPIPDEILRLTSLLSGEGRFRWLHARPGAVAALAEAAEGHFGELAWVRTRAQAEAEDWFGGKLDAEVASRLGDVVLAASAPVAFEDPADTGNLRLVSRHGSLTADEMLVPLLVASG